MKDRVSNLPSAITESAIGCRLVASTRSPEPIEMGMIHRLCSVQLYCTGTQAVLSVQIPVASLAAVTHSNHRRAIVSNP